MMTLWLMPRFFRDSARQAAAGTGHPPVPGSVRLCAAAPLLAVAATYLALVYSTFDPLIVMGAVWIGSWVAAGGWRWGWPVVGVIGLPYLLLAGVAADILVLGLIDSAAAPLAALVLVGGLGGGLYEIFRDLTPVSSRSVR